MLSLTWILLSKAAAKDPLQPLNTALDYYSDTPMKTQCGPCHISPGTSDVKTVLRPGSPNHEPLQHDGNLEEPLALQKEEWKDKQKEEAPKEALRNLTSHPKMMQVPHVFVFAARPSGIKLSLPENFWVLTTHAQDVSFALNFRQQHPGLGKKFGPITRLVNAHGRTLSLISRVCRPKKLPNRAVVSGPRLIASCSDTPWWTMTVLGSHTMYAGRLLVRASMARCGVHLRSPLASLPPRETQLCRSYPQSVLSIEGEVLHPMSSIPSWYAGSMLLVTSVNSRLLYGPGGVSSPFHDKRCLPTA